MKIQYLECFHVDLDVIRSGTPEHIDPQLVRGTREIETQVAIKLFLSTFLTSCLSYHLRLVERVGNYHWDVTEMRQDETFLLRLPLWW